MKKWKCERRGKYKGKKVLFTNRGSAPKIKQTTLDLTVIVLPIQKMFICTQKLDFISVARKRKKNNSQTTHLKESKVLFYFSVIFHFWAAGISLKNNICLLNFSSRYDFTSGWGRFAYIQNVAKELIISIKKIIITLYDPFLFTMKMSTVYLVPKLLA